MMETYCTDMAEISYLFMAYILHGHFMDTLLLCTVLLIERRNLPKKKKKKVTLKTGPTAVIANLSS